MHLVLVSYLKYNLISETKKNKKLFTKKIISVINDPYIVWLLHNIKEVIEDCW